MTYAPGLIPASALVEVEPGCFLLKRQARAYRRVKAAFQQAGKTFTIVGRYAAYRDAELQTHMASASRSPKGSAARRKYNLSSTSTVPVAYHPNGTHECGDRFDLLVNGSSNPGPESLALLAKHGWHREFGAADPNHVKHDDKHSVVFVTRAWCIRNKLFVGPR